MIYVVLEILFPKLINYLEACYKLVDIYRLNTK